MQTSFDVLHADGRVSRGMVDLPDEPDLKELRAVVEPYLDGDDMERVRVWHDGAYTDLFVGERSAVLGLPRNERATAIYRANTIAHEKPTPNPETMPAIYGTAVMFDRRVWF